MSYEFTEEKYILISIHRNSDVFLVMLTILWLVLSILNSYFLITNMESYENMIWMSPENNALYVFNDNI